MPYFQFDHFFRFLCIPQIIEILSKKYCQKIENFIYIANCIVNVKIKCSQWKIKRFFFVKISFFLFSIFLFHETRFLICFFFLQIIISIIPLRLKKNSIDLLVDLILLMLLLLLSLSSENKNTLRQDPKIRSLLIEIMI